MRFERVFTSFCNRKLLKKRAFQPCQLSSSTKMAQRYKDNFIYFIIFFFSKDKNLGSSNTRRRVVKEMCYLNGMLIMASILIRQ